MTCASPVELSVADRAAIFIIPTPCLLDGYSVKIKSALTFIIIFFVDGANLDGSTSS